MTLIVPFYHDVVLRPRLIGIAAVKHAGCLIRYSGFRELAAGSTIGYTRSYYRKDMLPLVSSTNKHRQIDTIMSTVIASINESPCIILVVKTRTRGANDCTITHHSLGKISVHCFYNILHDKYPTTHVHIIILLEQLVKPEVLAYLQCFDGMHSVFVFLL